MPFFPQVYLSPEANFLSLLADLDVPQRQQQKSCAPRVQYRRQRQETFTPRFDITETEQAYELFGELPGIEQKDLEIEFSDAQTLIIKGKTERSASTTNEVVTPAPAQESETEKYDDASSQKSHTATVEDDYDEADTPLAPTPATTAANTVEPREQQQAETPKSEEPKSKYWVSERQVGSFARSFSFSQRIEQDEVQASLHNGILHLVVPKSVKSKRVAVSVL